MTMATLPYNECKIDSVSQCWHMVDIINCKCPLQHLTFYKAAPQKPCLGSVLKLRSGAVYNCGDPSRIGAAGVGAHCFTVASDAGFVLFCLGLTLRLCCRGLGEA